MRRLRRGDVVERDVNFGITATTEKLFDVVASVKAAVNK
jgi:hypothetical protein